MLADWGVDRCVNIAVFLFLYFHPCACCLTKRRGVGHVAVVGMMGLKKTAMSTLCIPLVVFTVIFSIYLHGQHFQVPMVLPTQLCLKQDRRNRDLDYSFLEDSYLQPEMCEKDGKRQILFDSFPFGFWRISHHLPRRSSAKAFA